MKKELNNFANALKTTLFDLLPILAAFFAPAFYVMMLVIVLVLVDTRLGIVSAKKRKIPLTTNRFSDFFAKIIGYAIFISIGLLIQLETGLHYVVWLASIIPIYTEIKSIDENQKAVGKKGIIKQFEEVYQFALNIKKKRDTFR